MIADSLGGIFSGKYKTKDIPEEGRFSQVTEGDYMPPFPRMVGVDALKSLAKCTVTDTSRSIHSVPAGSVIKLLSLSGQDATFEALRLIEPVASKHSLTLLEIALRWCVHHSKLSMKNGGRDGVIIGISSLSQLTSNLADFEKGPLPEEVVQILDHAWLTVTKASCPEYFR